MPADTTGKAVQVLDLMLDFFAEDDHWTRGRYHDPHGRHCLVGAVLHFSARHGLPRAPVMSLLEAALPQRQIGLIGFNDRRCRSPAELRSVILRPARSPSKMRNTTGRPRHSNSGSSPNWIAIGLYAGPPAAGPPRKCLCLRSGLQPRPIRFRRA